MGADKGGRRTAGETPMTTGQRWTMVAVVLGSGIVFLDTTIVNAALPKIGQELPASIFLVLESQSFVYNSYLLSLSSLLILAGALSDFHGRCKMFKLGLTGFGATSLLCGLAPNMESLIFFRLLQGAAGALLVPGSLAIINAGFNGEQRGRAFGIWAGGSGLTTIVGPFVGGLLVDGVSWRAAFLINVPLVLVAYYATRNYIEESRDENATGKFDWMGALLVAVGLGGLVFGTIRGQQRNWDDTAAFGALALGVASSVALPAFLKRTANPLIPLELFRSRNFTVTNISTFLIYGALYVSFYFIGLFLQGTLCYNAAAAGLSSIPAFFFLAFFSARFGRLSAKYGPRLFMTAGPFLMGAGLLWLVRTPATSPAWIIGKAASGCEGAAGARGLLPPAGFLIDFLPAYTLFGIGTMIMVAPLTTALMTSVPSRHSGVASAVNNAISRVGPQLAGALVFVAITSGFYTSLAHQRPELPVDSQEFRKAVSPLNSPSKTAMADAPEELADEIRRSVPAINRSSTESFRRAMAISSLLLFAGAAVNAAGIHDSHALAAWELDAP